jgi:hypothetical protein
MIRGIRTLAVAGCAAVLLAGCKKTDDNTANFTKAINTYYASRPECVWPESKKLPAQATTSDTSETSGYDALVDQGLLQRTTAEKKRFLVGSKQVTNYDLTDSGRSAWTADTQQPGFGNFCYGTRTVTHIDRSTPTTGEVGATTVVDFHTTVASVPGWASAQETRTAFPRVASDLAGPVAGSATLADTANGWVVSAGPERSKATNADGAIVQ